MNKNLSRRFRKAFSAIAILALAILTGGMSYEAIGRNSEVRRFPVRGRMVDIGGYRLNINCTGVGTPTVILDSGLGEPALSWSGVQAGVERFSGQGVAASGRSPRQARSVITRERVCLRASAIAFAVRNNSSSRSMVVRINSS